MKKSHDKNKVEVVMGEFKRGGLRSGGGEKVTNQKQAMAIAMSEAGMSKKHSSHDEGYSQEEVERCQRECKGLEEVHSRKGSK